MKVLFTNRLNVKVKFYSTAVANTIINNTKYESDSFTNVSSNILGYLNKKLYKQQDHPLNFVKERIIQYFHKTFINRKGNAIFSVHDQLNPVVTVQQNFDSLLVPTNHVSRSKKDCFYINKDLMLRAHMTAHQSELLKMGLNNFLMVGDVYRRDSVDATHFPVFHQLDGVRTFAPEELFIEEDDGLEKISIKENKIFERSKEKQETYTLKASKAVEKELKSTLENLTKDLFGSNIKYRWIDAYFPFTHPSWELEILLDNKWVEMLGCGVIEHKILETAGCGERIGWAVGLGLERLAMLYYSIPDIRILWSTDPGFLCQFKGKNCNSEIKFKEFSRFPSCPFDMSFWISKNFVESDFCEIVRKVCGDIVEQIILVDSYKCKKTEQESRCYRIVYRSFVTTLNKEELNIIHKNVEKAVVEAMKVVVR